jgi:hypothetical protein
MGSGMVGGGQCGTEGGDYQYVHQSWGIDVASYHDYGADNNPMPGDRRNGLKARLDQAAAAGKPIIVGEVGIRAGNSGPCVSLSDRAAWMNAKMDGEFNAVGRYGAGENISGFTPWDFWPDHPNGTCEYENVTFGDPLIRALNQYPIAR